MHHGLCEDFPGVDWRNNYTTQNHLDQIIDDQVGSLVIVSFCKVFVFGF